MVLIEGIFLLHLAETFAFSQHTAHTSALNPQRGAVKREGYDHAMQDERVQDDRSVNKADS